MAADLTSLCTDLTRLDYTYYLPCLGLAHNGNKVAEQLLDSQIPALSSTECPLVDMRDSDATQYRHRRGCTSGNPSYPNCDDALYDQ